MKYISEYVEKQCGSPGHMDAIVVSFFFHARGEELERSSAGLYRSTLFQLFSKAPRLQSTLDEYSILEHETWKLHTLQSLLKRTVDGLASTQLYWFIDALDECPDGQMRELVTFLEELGNLAIKGNKFLRICLSSRHYPHVSIQAGMQSILEEQEGHRNDLVKYIAAELKIGKSSKAESIKIEIFEKSRRIFLWVVLVVQILKKEYDQGKVRALRSRLDVIPLELDDLFLDILRRDNNEIEQLVLCMQWILYARRPLRREEFYFALLEKSEGIVQCDSELDTVQIMDKLIINCSKGLAETTRAKNPTVQFIHESVREFLQKPGTLEQLWSGISEIAPRPSHKRLLQDCSAYLKVEQNKDIKDLLKQRLTPATLSDRARKLYPFLDYAIEHVLSHAEELEKMQPSQATFLAELPLAAWITLYNLMQRFQVRRLPAQTTLLYVLARSGLPYLLALALRHPHLKQGQQSLEFNDLVLLSLDDKEDKKHVAFRTLARIRDNTAQRPLREEAPVPVIVEYLQATRIKSGAFYRPESVQIVISLLQCWASEDTTSINAAFLEAARMRHEDTVCYLLEHGANVNTVDAENNTALHLVALHQYLPKHRSKSQIEQSDDTAVLSMVSFLLGHGANSVAINNEGQTPLHVAISNSKAPIIRILLDHGAFKDLDPSRKGSILRLAIEKDKFDIVHDFASEFHLNEHETNLIKSDYLEQEVMEIDHQRQHSRCLETAVSESLCQLVKALHALGVSLDFQTASGTTILHIAMKMSNTTMVTLLLDLGAPLELKDTKGETPLLSALLDNHIPIAEIFIGYKSSLAAKDSKGRSALHIAALKGHNTVLPLLIQDSAMLEATDKMGFTPLHTAVCNRQFQTSKILISAGGNVNSICSEGKSILTTAADIGATDLVEYLCEHGAQLIFHGASETPLGAAIRRGRDWIRQYLLLADAKIASKRYPRRDQS